MTDYSPFCSYNKKNEREKKLSEKEVFDISYLIFFYGVGAHSFKIVRDLITSRYRPFFDEVEDLMVTEIEKEMSSDEDKNYHLKGHSFPYKPCLGHISRLGHYYRNIFQIIEFIDRQDDNFISYDEKYQYSKMLRAQLSTYEQILLYYNAVSSLGESWIKTDKNGESLLEKYCMIKNLPIPMADFYNKYLLAWEKKGENLCHKQMFELKY